MEINSRNENVELNNIINNLDLNENNEEIDINIIEDNIDVVTETSEYLETEFNVIPMTSESDPIFLSSPAHNITNSDIENWNSKQERLIAGDNIRIENNVISSEASGGTANFDELDNRPKYNSNVMNHLTNIPLVPTKTSDLENDSEFITKNVNNLVNYTKSSLLGTLALKNNVDYNTEVTNKPTIPTKTSDLTNDSGFITEHQDLSNYPTLDGLNIFSNAQKILSNAYAGLSLYYDTDNYVNFGYTGFHYNTNGESGTIDYKDIGSGGSGEFTPIGTISQWGTDTAPDGWLICDGSAISRTAYNELFAIIGTTYGAGDGTTTFNLPDMRGRVLVGAGTQTDDRGETKTFTLAENLGEYNHLLTINEMPSHQHGSYGWGGCPDNSSYITLGANYSSTSSYNTRATGGSQVHNNIQPSLIVNFIIKANHTTEIPESSQVKNTYSESITDTYSCDYINNNGGGVSPTDLLNYIYPIGSVYLSVNNVSPQTFLGGTWVRFAQGRALVGVDENDTSINTSLKEVGSSLLQQHNHSYTTNNPGDHTHRGRYRGGALGQYYFLRRINSADGYDGEDQVTYGAGGHTHSGTTGNSGAGNSNNIPPEISIYCWRRTA